VSDARKFISFQNVSNSEKEEWAERLICICGPSGSGKTSLCRRLLEKFPEKFGLLGCTVTSSRSKFDLKQNNYKIIGTNDFLYMIERNEFLHWYKTGSGYYGLEKSRIREAVSKNFRVLVTFRSKSADALKFALRNLLIIELRADLQTIESRIIRRNRIETKLIDKKVKIASIDLRKNNMYFKQWSSAINGNWYQLLNNIEEPPISESLVEMAHMIITEKD